MTTLTIFCLAGAVCEGIIVLLRTVGVGGAGWQGLFQQPTRTYGQYLTFAAGGPKLCGDVSSIVSKPVCAPGTRQPTAMTVRIQPC
jgi:hypothetical protein